MDISAFQMFKNNNRTNMNDRLHNTPIIDYGRIIKIIDKQTVIVKKIVHVSHAEEFYTVTLLSFSSVLFEVNIAPKIDDTVLLLFFRHHDPKMFVKDSISNPNAVGYNKFSGVGILMATARNAAAFVTSFYETDGEAVADITSLAQVRGSLSGALILEFCRAVFDSDDVKQIVVSFESGRPLLQRHLSKTEREYGFQEDADGEFVELDAAVTERYSKHAPITKDIQGEQAYTMHAPIQITLGEEADVDFNSQSNITIAVAKDVEASIDGDLKTDVGGDLTVGIGGGLTLDVGGNLTASVTGNKEESVTGNATADITGNKEENVVGTAKYSSAATSIESIAPIGLNAGLYSTGLAPYLAVEMSALVALKSAAAAAATPLGILDGMAGGTGALTALGSAIIAYCAAMEAADTAANASIAAIIK